MAALAILGTASDVGESVVTVGFCRLFSDAGLDVVPFKAQNMANQAGVTADGLEMSRAQILQARAARREPRVEMGPVLLKPVTETGAQVVVLGKAARRSIAPPIQGRDAPVDEAAACIQPAILDGA